MARRNQLELEKALAEFVEARAGLRVSRTFGRVSGYAGRRMFARVTAAGLECRLPRDLVRRELARGARPANPHVRPDRDRATAAWIRYSLASGRIDRTLARVLEEAARHAAASVAGGGLPGPRGERHRIGRR
jgi:hypothetical protein